MLHKPNRLTLVEQVALQMEALIESGQWQVGTRIPAEPELMAALSVSRNTLREAIRALIHAGLLKTRQGDGTYVCSSSALGAVLQRRILKSDFQKALEVRHALEREAAYLSAQRRTDQDISAMQAHLQHCELAVKQGDKEAYIQADIQFHQAVAAASHNDILIDLYAHIAEALQETITSMVELNELGFYQETHQSLVKAIIERNSKKAVEAVHQYIEESKRYL